MATFGFRLRFQLPFGVSFRGVRPKRRIHLKGITGRIYLMKLSHERKFRSIRRPEYALRGTLFASQSEAAKCGRRLKYALLLFAAQSRMGIDAGQDKATAGIGEFYRKLYSDASGTQIRDNILGLDTFDEQPEPRWVSMFGKGKMSWVIKDYQAPLNGFYEREFDWTAKQQLALQLYNVSHFESAPKVRFLALVTVVEVLAVQQKRSIQAIALLNSMRAVVKAATDLSIAEKLSIDRGISILKRESISAACKAFVLANETSSDAEYFANCYKARSELVHDGTTKRNEASDPGPLDEIVSRVLLTHLTAI